MRFSQIPGHSDIKKKLVQMHQNNRTSHAIIFIGEEGSANLAICIAFAQYINCEQTLENDSCGSCKSCVKFEKYAHPDLHFYYPTVTSKKVSKDPLSKHYTEEWRAYLLQNPYVTKTSWLKAMNPDRKDAIISTGDSKELIKTISLKSFESDKRFAIVWPAEKLNVHSSNRLLKIIEEPPKNAYIFLVTENDEMVLPTILSRTQNIRIGRISDREMKTWLTKKSPDLSEDLLEHAIKSSEGNPHKALKILEGGGESEDTTEFFIHWARLCYQAYDKMPDLIDHSEDMAKKSREEQNMILKYGIEFFRNALLHNNHAQDATYVKEVEKKHVQNFAPLLNVENSAKLASSFEKAMDHLSRYANAKIIFLDLSLDFARNINAKNVHL